MWYGRILTPPWAFSFSLFQTFMICLVFFRLNVELSRCRNEGGYESTTLLFIMSIWELLLPPYPTVFDLSWSVMQFMCRFIYKISMCCLMRSDLWISVVVGEYLEWCAIKDLAWFLTRMGNDALRNVGSWPTKLGVLLPILAIFLVFS